MFHFTLALAEIQGQGCEADHRGDRGHQPGTQANLRGLEDGIAAGQFWSVQMGSRLARLVQSMREEPGVAVR